MLAISLWQVVGILAFIILIGWVIYKVGSTVRQSGRDDQAAKDAQRELAERKEADAKMDKAAEDYAKKGGAEEALKRGDF